MSSDRTTLTNTLHLGHGTATILVDHWLSDPQGTTPNPDEIVRTVDHVMGSVARDIFQGMDGINRSILARNLEVGDVTHVSTRSMSIDGVTMRVKVGLRLTREVPSYVLAMEVDKILQGAALCMVHLLDGSLANVEMPAGFALDGLFGGSMPEGMQVMSVPADLFARMAGGGPRSHDTTGDSRGGMYL